MDNGYHFTGPTSSVNSSFIFLIAFVHIIHIIVALIALIVFVETKIVYSHNNLTGFDLASIFWHLVFYGFTYLYFWYSSVKIIIFVHHLIKLWQLL